MKQGAALALLILLLWSLGLSTRSITRPDEGRYAEIAREMAVSGDWITPHLNGIPYFEKPPLQYWATAGAIKLFGPTEWAARAWSASTGLACLLWVWFLGNRLFGIGAGWRSALVLSGSIYFAALGHINSLDMGLTFWMTISVGAFLLAQFPDSQPKTIRRWMGLAWAGAAAALLSKGLIALALPGTTLLLYSLWNQDFSSWKRLSPLTGGLLFLLLAAPWFWFAAQEHPEFLRFFFIHEHFQRFASTVHQRVEPFWYFLPVLLAGLFPWTGMLWSSVVKPLRHVQARRFSPQRFLALYALFILVFFSLSGSKLPAYILPAFPALALLMGRQLLHQTHMPSHVPVSAMAGGVFLAVGATLLAFPQGAKALGVDLDVDPDMVTLYQHYAPWIASAATVWLAAGLWCWHQRARQSPALRVMALSSLLATQLLLQGSEALATVTSSKALVQQQAGALHQALPLYSVGTYDQVLDYYLQRTVTLVAFQDELAFGLTLQPGQAIATLKDFLPRWRSEPDARAIMTPDLYAVLTRAHWPLALQFRDSRHVIVAPTTPPAVSGPEPGLDLSGNRR